MVKDNIKIRPYQPQDRTALRQICCDVADRGEPIERLFSDRLMAADLLTTYYTDYEPQSSFVAEIDGQVVGYINGCLDNRRWGLVMFWLLIPRLIIKGLKRGVFFRPECWHMLRVAALNWRRLFSWRKHEFHSHQGHMHIGIAKDFRHQHIGELLIDALCRYAKSRGVGQLAASIHDGNVIACRFFQGHGFRVNESYPMIGVRLGVLEPYQALVYVKDLN
jgi:ribosomal protein S18 acetylase RimI-like enzyme